jgi:hypothetical protein
MGIILLVIVVLVGLCKVGRRRGASLRKGYDRVRIKKSVSCISEAI